MKNLGGFFLLLLLYGCSEHTTNSEITSFENVLGKDHSEELTKILEFFDRSLVDKFGTVSTKDAYELHLKGVYNSAAMQPAIWLKSQLKRDSLFRAYSSSLLEEIWKKPDTVWIQDSRIYWTYPNSKNISERKIFKNENDRDSLISAKSELEVFNINGSFIRAIKEISGTNEVAEWYYAVKNSASEISPYLTAQVFLNSRVNLDDYLIKRIILIETAIKTYSEDGEFR